MSIRLNALALIQTAMREHASDEEVQQQGCLALARFLPDGGQQVARRPLDSQRSRLSVLPWPRGGGGRC